MRRVSRNTSERCSQTRRPTYLPQYIRHHIRVTSLPALKILQLIQLLSFVVRFAFRMPCMSGNQRVPTIISFGPFEADLHTQELRKQGVRLRLPGQSFHVLKMLLDRPGGLVGREELHKALWPSGTFVDFED